MKRSLTVVGALMILLGGCYAVVGPHGVSMGIDVGPMGVAVAPPSMVYIPNTSIQVVAAPGVIGDVFYHSGIYWRCYNGMWYRRGMWFGDWIRVLSVPRVFLSIPTYHRAHRVVRYHPLYKRTSTKVIKTPAARTTVKGSTKSTLRPAVKKSGRPSKKSSRRNVFKARH